MNILIIIKVKPITTIFWEDALQMGLASGNASARTVLVCKQVAVVVEPNRWRIEFGDKCLQIGGECIKFSSITKMLPCSKRQLVLRFKQLREPSTGEWLLPHTCCEKQWEQDGEIAVRQCWYDSTWTRFVLWCVCLVCVCQYREHLHPRWSETRTFCPECEYCQSGIWPGSLMPDKCPGLSIPEVVMDG